MRNEACAGAVNDPAQMFELARRWRLGLFVPDEVGANVVWSTARDMCPEVFDSLDDAALPFPNPGGSPYRLGGGIDEQLTESVDIGLLEDAEWADLGGGRTGVVSFSSLDGPDLVDHFTQAFAAGWRVDEVIGPVESPDGATLWSLDVSGPDAGGVVEILTQTDGDVAVIVVLSRDVELPPVDITPPRANRDHFHSAYSIIVCGELLEPLPEDTADDVTGIHTHGDGLIHIHPFVEEAAGADATIGTFWEEADLEISDSVLGLPGRRLVEGTDTCDGQPAELRILKWTDIDDAEPDVFTDGLADVRLDQDSPLVGQLFTIAFVAVDTPNTEIPRPDDSFLREYIGLEPVTTTPAVSA